MGQKDLEYYLNQSRPKPSSSSTPKPKTTTFNFGRSRNAPRQSNLPSRGNRPKVTNLPDFTGAPSRVDQYGLNVYAGPGLVIPQGRARSEQSRPVPRPLGGLGSTGFGGGGTFGRPIIGTRQNEVPGGTGGRGIGTRQTPEDAPLPELPEFLFAGGPSLEDFLGQATNSAEALFSEQAAGFNNRRADLERRKAAALEGIGGSTEALAAALAASRNELDARMSQGIQEMGAANQDVQQDVSAQNQAAAAQNAELYKNLGIAPGVDTSAGLDHNSAGLGALAQTAQAADTEQRSRQLTSYGLGTTNVDASRVRGFEAQNAARSGYDSALAELLDQQEAARAQAASQAQSSAMDAYGRARGEYTDERDFAYREFVRQQEGAQREARDLLDFENQQTLAQQKAASSVRKSPEDSLIDQLVGYGVSEGKVGQWLNRAYTGGGQDGLDRGEFGAMFSKASPSAKAALFNYLKKSGLIK